MEVECCEPGSVSCSYCVIPEMLRLVCKARLSEMSCLNCGQWTENKLYPGVCEILLSIFLCH